MDQALLILAEECAEVIQATSKCQRFGWDGQHPSNSKSNRLRLEEEIGDVLAMIEILTANHQLSTENIQQAKYQKFAKLRIYSTLNLDNIGAP